VIRKTKAYVLGSIMGFFIGGLFYVCIAMGEDNLKTAPAFVSNDLSCSHKPVATEIAPINDERKMPDEFNKSRAFRQDMTEKSGDESLVEIIKNLDTSDPSELVATLDYYLSSNVFKTNLYKCLIKSCQPILAGIIPTLSATYTQILRDSPTEI